MSFAEIGEFLPVILPLGLIQIGLQVYCLLDLWRFSKDLRDKQDRWVWTLVVVLFSMFGALAYILLEKERP